MRIVKTPIDGFLILEPKVYEDSRGFFLETFQEESYKERGVIDHFVQDNQSTSNFGVLRGLHYQVGEMAQAKLVRPLQGSILDIVVDVRKDSKTFGKHFSIILDDIFQQQLFVPRGFAHGFITLSPTSTFAYKCDNFYDKDSERGIIYNDATLSLDWHLPKDKFILSEKDQILPTFLEATSE